MCPLFYYSFCFANGRYSIFCLTEDAVPAIFNGVISGVDLCSPSRLWPGSIRWPRRNSWKRISRSPPTEHRQIRGNDHRGFLWLLQKQRGAVWGAGGGAPWLPHWALQECSAGVCTTAPRAAAGGDGWYLRALHVTICSTMPMRIWRNVSWFSAARREHGFRAWLTKWWRSRWRAPTPI